MSEGLDKLLLQLSAIAAVGASLITWIVQHYKHKDKRLQREYEEKSKALEEGSVGKAAIAEIMDRFKGIEKHAKDIENKFAGKFNEQSEEIKSLAKEIRAFAFEVLHLLGLNKIKQD